MSSDEAVCYLTKNPVIIVKKLKCGHIYENDTFFAWKQLNVDIPCLQCYDEEEKRYDEEDANDSAGSLVDFVVGSDSIDDDEWKRTRRRENKKRKQFRSKKSNKKHKIKRTRYEKEQDELKELLREAQSFNDTFTKP